MTTGIARRRLPLMVLLLVLVDKCEQLIREPNDYHLVVEILADAIQSTPATAVQDAWGVTVGDNGTDPVRRYAR